MINSTGSTNNERSIRIGAGAVTLDGRLSIPDHARGLVILAHGIESIEHSDRIAQAFNQAKLATLIVDLFTPEEQKLDALSGYFRENSEIMLQRLIGMAEWLLEHPQTDNLSIGYFGIGACGTAALLAADERPDVVRTVVAAGGHSALKAEQMQDIVSPILLIVAEGDSDAVRVNQEILAALKGANRLEVVKGDRALFENERTINEVTRLASPWFAQWLVPIV